MPISITKNFELVKYLANNILELHYIIIISNLYSKYEILQHLIWVISSFHFLVVNSFLAEFEVYNTFQFLRYYINIQRIICTKFFFLLYQYTMNNLTGKRQVA